jgi:2-succinyl-5-enolpyruvyl-6-hydroxy-3-cyclohexene-1-carboxylate synthase
MKSIHNKCLWILWYLEICREYSGKLQCTCANSSAIRYTLLFNFSEKHEVYCNRGTSGIDGCTSTTMGFAMMNDNPAVLITGI